MACAAETAARQPDYEIDVVLLEAVEQDRRETLVAGHRRKVWIGFRRRAVLLRRGAQDNPVLALLDVTDEPILA
jgi:hypothetical protein